MSIPSSTLRQFFYDYRHSSAAHKEDLIEYLLHFDQEVAAQQRILRYALDYDILHPIADGRQNVLRSSEISVVLFKRVLQQLPKDIDRALFLSDIFVAISLEARRILTERLCVAKTGENYTKSISPFNIAYQIFLTLVLFDISALSKEEFSRYSALISSLQHLKAELRRSSLDTSSAGCKSHNAITVLEQMKLNFLKQHYGLSIEILTTACQSLAIKPEPLAIKEQDALIMSVQNDAERVQYQVILELNKLAYGQTNTFGRLRFAVSKPLACADEEFNLEKMPEPSVAATSKASFWQDKAIQFGDLLRYNRSELDTEAEWYYRFPPY